MDFKKDLSLKILALNNVIWVHTFDENKALREIALAIEELKTAPKYTNPISLNFGLWTLAAGLKGWTSPSLTDRGRSKDTMPALLDFDQEKTKDPLVLLETIRKFPKDLATVLLDFHRPLEQAVVCRAVRDFIACERGQQRMAPPMRPLIILSPTKNIPIELTKSIQVLRFPKPTRDELYQHITQISRTLADARKSRDKTYKHEEAFTPEQKEELIEMSIGKTVEEIDDMIAEGIVSKKMGIIPND